MIYETQSNDSALREYCQVTWVWKKRKENVREKFS
jgi:hypothetical protein